MTTALALLILIAPFAVAAVLSWVARRSGSLRARIDRLRVSAPIGRFFDRDRDGSRIEHDLDAVRTRFEQVLFRPV